MEKTAELRGKYTDMPQDSDEAVWHNRVDEARRLRDDGDEQGFVRHALAAYNIRPWRAEPLYDLARHYRQKGMNAAGAIFAEAGLAVNGPRDDALFIEDFVYKYGLLEEYSIVANYAREHSRKDRGFAACNRLALSRDCPEHTRNLARHNIFFYLKAAAEMMPSFTAKPVNFEPPDGFHPSNPSVARLGDEIVLNQRTVNVSLTEDGRYETPDGAPERSRNFLLRLTNDLQIKSAIEVLPPVDLPAPKFHRILGFQDVRLFVWSGGLWCIAAVRELNESARYEQVLARIDIVANRFADCRILHPELAQEHEKNWMPWLIEGELRFIYLCDPTRILDAGAVTVSESHPGIYAQEFRGGSQAVTFGEDWLAVIHEVIYRDGKRFYHHRFVTFDRQGRLTGVSRPFFFQKRGIEFAAGLAWHPDGLRLLVSFGVDDRESWIATVAVEDVSRAIDVVNSSSELLPANLNAKTASKKENAFPLAVLAGPPAPPAAVLLPPEDALATAAVLPPTESAHAAMRTERVKYPAEKTIGLCMIVKDEAHVIERCLSSVRDLVDYVLIEDTGSTDGTQEIIRDWLEREGIEGQVIHEPWRNFAHNRNVVLSAMRKRSNINYTLIIDADDFIVFDEELDIGAFKAGLNKDLYFIETRRETVSFQMTFLVNNRKKFAYRGVLHEIIFGPNKGHSSALASGLHLSYSQEGARGKDPDKFRKDAHILENALKTERDPWQRSRYAFYLAQSWLGAGEQQKALDAYARRAKMAHWVQEIYWSYFRIAHLQEELGFSLDEVLASFEKASRVIPRRAEALHAAALRCRIHGRYQEAYELATKGLAIAPPTDSLFHVSWVYEYGLLDEFAISAYWIGRYRESLEACDRLVSDSKCPGEVLDRIRINRSHAAEKLAALTEAANLDATA